MIVKCEGCMAKFRIDENRIKPQGSKVRCSKCGNVFRVFKPGEQPLTEGTQSGTPDTTIIEIVSGKSRFPNMEEKGKRTVSSTTTPPDSGRAATSTERALERGMAEGGSRKQGSWYEDVKDKERTRRAKPPARRIQSLANADSEEGIEADEPFDDEDIFDWDSLEVGEEGVEPIREAAEGGQSEFHSPEPKDLGDRRQGEAFDFEGQAGGTPPQDYEGGAGPIPEQGQEDLQGDEEEAPQHHHSDPYTQEIIKTKVVDHTIGHTRRPPRTYPRGSVTHFDQGSEQGSIKKAMGIFAGVIVAIVLLVSGGIALINSGFLSDKGLLNSLSSIISGRAGSKGETGVDVTDDTGAWLSTSNGYIFVVSGLVTNDSPYVINFIQVEGEFISSGESLFSRVAYAGNTFTQEELKTMSIEQIERRLDRRNGDINFTNTEKLAGLNYELKPGEHIPFYIVYPSEKKILGLRYRVWVSGFEKGPKVR